MLDLTIQFAVALFIGALVGIEREKKKSQDETTSAFGGIRTFILIALAGAISAWLSLQLKTPWIFIFSSLLISSFILVGYIVQNRTNKAGALGLTSETAGVIVFLLGGTTLFGYKEIAVALAIATSAVLAYKRPLHGFVGKLEESDIYAALTLLFATFIVLPVIPNKPIDPWEAINPYKMWLLVILISSLSFVGYVATKWLGEKIGASLTGLFGGMVSSTAVTLSFSKQSKETKESDRWMYVLGASLLIAWSVMFIRILIEVAVVNVSLLRSLMIPMITMALVAGIFAFIYYRKQGTKDDKREGGSVVLRNPFSLISALKFAGLFAIIMLAVKYVQQNYPGQGFYIVAALAGLTDVDAITLSMAEYAKSGGEAKVAVQSITIAAITNTLVKCGLVFFLGGGKFKTLTAIAAAIILAAGLAALLFV
ncbi:MAG TPA: MgtC/SapB family protein [Acidobacteriota bacterium]|nr:MgtC/SapB family protein [Acidobacteriota bacterium]